MPTSPHLTRTGLRIAACAAFAFPTAALAQGNDECAAALNPPAPSLPFTNPGAPPSLPPWTCAQGGNDLWYRFTAPCNGRVTVSTLAAPPQPLDTTLEVFAGTTATCGNLQLLACNDDT